jgi:hypothetical protein
MSELVEIGRITVGVRRRDDLGDLAGLMESMSQHSLLHPIVVTEDYALIAGQRRLEAAKQLGWQTIEVTTMGELTEEEQREIELEENLHRKDLTQLERDKTLLDLASAVKARLSRDGFPQSQPGPEEFSPPDGEKPTMGRRPLPDSQERVAKEIGVGQQRISDAQRHVQTVERYPELADKGLSRAEVFRQAAEWDAIQPQRKRTFARKAWAKAREAPETPEMPETPDPEVPMAPAAPVAKASKPKARKRRRRPQPTVATPPTRPWYYFSAGLLQVITDFERSGGVLALLPLWTEDERQQAVHELAARLAQLTRVQDELLASRSSGPLRLITGRGHG